MDSMVATVMGDHRLAELGADVRPATVTEDTSGRKETYTGVTSRPFKKRYYEHNTDIRKVKGRTKTALSSHIWNLKDHGTSYQIK